MIKRTTESSSTHQLFVTSMRNQLFLSVSVEDRHADPARVAENAYRRIGELLASTSSRIIHERCFGAVGLQPQVLEIRARELRKQGLESDTPVTFVEGESCLGNDLAGIQIRALAPVPGTRIRTLLDQGIPKGRAWNLDGATFFMLQSVDGGRRDAAAGKSADRESQSDAMFRQAERLLRAEGASYRDVLRTWIYISDILDWYGDFNTVRNRCYSEYGFLKHPEDAGAQAEQIYLPASTGIEGKNPAGRPAVMDVFAVRRSPGSQIQVRPLYGSKQRSPFRYGSAFSRAMVVDEPEGKLILVSGTASIDEDGKSVFIGDTAAQIRQTLNVVSTLIAPEGATLRDLCEATVFMKRREDFPLYREIAGQAGIAQAPSVNVVADVCRDELLFELDAAFVIEKNGRVPASSRDS
jgi:enamine deaminase RidA (YjgF/YER057c/UK114 family)